MGSFSWFGQKVIKFEVKGYWLRQTAPKELNSKMILRFEMVTLYVSFWKIYIAITRYSKASETVLKQGIEITD